jgi:hypothetical protein
VLDYLCQGTIASLPNPKETKRQTANIAPIVFVLGNLENQEEKNKTTSNDTTKK